MPQIMGSQRIIQLAAIKQCVWMFGGGPFTPVLRISLVWVGVASTS
jgi:hypothetical protein